MRWKINISWIGLMIGNDIVDLNDPQGRDKYKDHRFLKRVCAKSEIEFLFQSTNPHATLWTFWAIKEACFKVIQKVSVNAKFIPNQFLCFIENKNQWKCKYGDILINITLSLTNEYVHALAFHPQRFYAPNDIIEQEIKKISNPDLASSEVRNSALKLLEKQGYKNCRIERELIDGKLQPPLILYTDFMPDYSDISLSHHENFVASAIFLSATKKLIND